MHGGRAWVVLVTLAVLGAVPSPGRGQDPFAELREGTHAFRRLLEEMDLQPLESWDDLGREPERKLVIALGDLREIQAHARELEACLDRGGALLLATDRPWMGIHQNQVWGRVDGGKLRIDPDSDFSYHQAPHSIFLVAPLPRPRIKLLSLRSWLDPNRKSRVATNRPSWIASYSPHLELLVQLPEESQAEDTFLRSRVGRTFAVGGAWPFGKGRLLVLADHSLFINEMMLQDDLDNFEFAYNCVHWLTAGGQRTQVLFVEDGVIQREFHSELKEPELPPLPPLEALVPLVNDALRGFQEENVFNSLLLGAVPLDQLLRGLIAVLTLALAVYGFYRLSQARHPVDRTAPPLDVALAGPMTVQAAVAQRHADLLRTGNLWEAARALARQCFAEIPQPSGTAGGMPQVRVAGGWWRRREISRQVRALWALAHSPGPTPVSPRYFARLVRQVRAVRAGLTHGLISLEWPDPKEQRR